MRLSGVVARAAALATCLAIIQAAAALGHAVVPQLVTTGPGDTGQRSYAEVIAASADGERAIFGSTEPMTPDDRVNGFDLFERVGQSTRLLTPPIDGLLRPEPEFASPLNIKLVAVSPDATRIVFASPDPWTPDDQDRALDVFAVEAGRVERISQGPAGGNAELDAGPVSPGHVDSRPPGSAGASLDARRVLFTTRERLTEDDTDKTTDVYAREGNTTTKVSPGNGEVPDEPVRPAVRLLGWSNDFRRVAIASPERLTADDQDDQYDVFLVDGATTMKLSPGDGPYDAGLPALSDDGQTALISTNERLLPSDGDAGSDIYRLVVGGGTQLVSAGPNDFAADHIGVQSGYMTPNGGAVVFTSVQRHTSDDTDDQLDTFLWTPERVVKLGRGNGDTGPPVVDWSSGSNPPAMRAHSLYSIFEGATPDASKVIVASPERMTPDDLDDRTDLFEVDTRTGDVERVSTGPRGGNDDVETIEPDVGHGALVFFSPDGSRVMFETQEALVEEDTDQAADVYQRAGGVTTLLSLAPEGSIPAPARWVTGSVDGSVAYIRTQEQLTQDDRNRRSDDYRVRPPAPGVVVGKPALSLLPPPWRVRIRSGKVRLATDGDGLLFSVSHTDRITVRIDRVKKGRRAGGRCRRPTAQRRHRRACTRYVPVRRHWTFAVKERHYVLVFGRVLRKGHRLRRGDYRVTLKPRGGKAVRVVLTLHR
jgi:hypothetical protein